MKKVSFLLALLGVVLGTILVGAFGFRRVIDSLLSVGVAGFAIVVLWQFLLFVPLGLGWEVLARALGVHRVWLFIWGRMVRDCSTNLLPFSQLGGFFFGARAVMLHGLAWPEATATTVVDLTAEFIAEVVFAAIGLMILLVKDPNTDMRVPLEIGIGLAVVAATGFIWLQRGASGLFAGLSSRIAARQLSGARETMSVLRERMNTIYEHRGHLALGFFWHLAGWVATGVGGWIAFRLLGARLDVAAGIAIESLVAAIAAVTFLVPVGAGVQEAGYTALGALFGVPPQLSLAVSLLRRSRDVVVGVPVLLIWQALEAKRLRASVVSSQTSVLRGRVIESDQ